MLKKINRQTAIEKYPLLPRRQYDAATDDYIFNYPAVFAGYVLTLPSKSYKGHVKLLGTELVSLMQVFNTGTLIFIGDEDIAWLRRWETYNNFQDSLKYLADQKIGKRFSGALIVDVTEISLFVKHLMWLVQTNGVLPYVHFTNPGQQFIGSFCQYANLHFSVLNRKADDILKTLLNNTSFELLKVKNCVNKFSASNKIKGRTVIV